MNAINESFSSKKRASEIVFMKIKDETPKLSKKNNKNIFFIFSAQILTFPFYCIMAKINPVFLVFQTFLTTLVLCEDYINIYGETSITPETLNELRKT